jgi:hypothetical protein
MGAGKIREFNSVFGRLNQAKIAFSLDWIFWLRYHSQLKSKRALSRQKQKLSTIIARISRQ